MTSLYKHCSDSDDSFCCACAASVSHGKAALFLPSLTALAATATSVCAAAIMVPNGSFESQAAPLAYPYVTTSIDSWQKAPKPVWFDETAAGIYWDQTAGLFRNPPVGAPNRLTNMDGSQGLYFFALPQVALWQDFDSTAWNQPTPSHAFDARFLPGQSYQLTVGVLGGLGGMTSGASLELALYYRDDSSNPVTVASTAVIYTAGAFPNPNEFVDFTVSVPNVLASEAWANQHIGVRLLSTFGTGEGYWDLDNVRLNSVPEPTVVGLLSLGLPILLVARRRVCP